MIAIIMEGVLFVALVAAGGALLYFVLTSFTPCIFPMIPITLAVLGHGAEKRSRAQNFLLSLCYVHGIALTYSVMGVIAASSRFGSITMPSSTSTKTGRAPIEAMAPTVAKNVYGVVITSSPGPTLASIALI